MDKQFIFTHGFLINRPNITYAQLLSASTINQVNVTFRDGATLTIKAEDETEAVKIMRLLQHGETIKPPAKD